MAKRKPKHQPKATGNGGKPSKPKRCQQNEPVNKSPTWGKVAMEVLMREGLKRAMNWLMEKVIEL